MHVGSSGAAVTTGAPSRSLGRRLRPALLAAGTATLVLGVLAVHDPREPGSYLMCPSLALTGLACPGCGSLRALNAITRGDLGDAWGYNPLAVLALVGLAVGWVFWIVRLARGRPRQLVAPPWLLLLLAGVLLAYGVLRNVPGVAHLLGPLAVS